MNSSTSNGRAAVFAGMSSWLLWMVGLPCFALGAALAVCTPAASASAAEGQDGFIPDAVQEQGASSMALGETPTVGEAPGSEEAGQAGPVLAEDVASKDSGDLVSGAEGSPSEAVGDVGSPDAAETAPDPGPDAAGDPSTEDAADTDAAIPGPDADLAVQPSLGEADPAQQVAAAQDAALQAAQTGAFAVTGGTYGTDYRYQDGVLTVLTSTPITVAMAEPGTTTGDAIVVASDAPANVTLQDVSIDCSATGSSQTFGTAAFDVRSGGVNLTVKGRVTLKSGSLQAGLQAGSSKNRTPSCPIVIDAGNDSLFAYGGYHAAGIGTGYGTGCSAGVTVNGGYVYAYGGEGAAGIGGAAGAWGTNVSVPGIAHVYAYGGSGGAGIGGGLQQYGKELTFSAGVVQAHGGDGAAGIGNGASAFSQADAILIEGMATVSAYGGADAAAIGGGRGSGLYDCTVTDGYILLERGSGDTEPIGHGSRSTVSGRTLVGGYYVQGSKDDDTVYGMKVADGYQVEEVSRLHGDEFYGYHVVLAKAAENPSEPVNPDNPDNPDDPEGPGPAENPSEPAQPSKPVQPATPAQPPTPAKPAAPQVNQVPKTADATETPVVPAAAGGVVLGAAIALLARLRGFGRRRG